MNNKIQHKGIIQTIEGESIYVKTLQLGACESCQSKFICNSSEQKEKIIEVTDTTGDYQIGEEVIISCSSSIGLKATLYAFIIPLFIIAITLFTFIKININEGVSALISIFVLGIYFIILYFLKDKFKKKFTFTLKKL